MCGNHFPDGTPVDHHHERPKKIFYPRPHPRSRRAFLGSVGGSMAMAIVTPTVLAACSSGAEEPESVAADQVASRDGSSSALPAEPNPTATPAPTSEPSQSDASPSDSAQAEPTPAADPEVAQNEAAQTDPAESDPTQTDPAQSDLIWARTNLGFVSAYVLVRGNSAAIVDTGTSGSAAAIGQTLVDLGLNYSDVEHVVLTHHHADHAGSIDAVLAEAVNATAYAGQADLDQLPGDLTAVVGGEDIFGFEVVATPGHTPGHIVVIDHQAGVLVAGDAIFTDGGGVVEGPERFFDNVPQSRDSIKAMAALSFNTLLVGHGDPIEQAADSAVGALAASLS